MKAMALTDHGSMASFVDFVKKCNKYNVKPIIGNEIYEVDDMWEKADTKEYTQPLYHLILLARTQESACQAGRLSRYIVSGKYEEAKQYIDKLKSTFDYVVCELQSHNTEDQAAANKLISVFSKA